MKKVIALLLVVIMCLSLVACGSNKEATENEQAENAPIIQEVPAETVSPPIATAPAEIVPAEPTVEVAPEPVYETVEITMDNWQEYFELGYSEIEWVEDEWGDAVEVRQTPVLFVKEEYYDKMNRDNRDCVDITVEFFVDTGTISYEIDWENKTATFGEFEAENNEPYLVTCTSQEYFSPNYWGNEFRSPCVIYVRKENNVVIARLITGISRIEGTITYRTS